MFPAMAAIINTRGGGRRKTEESGNRVVWSMKKFSRCHYFMWATSIKANRHTGG